MERPFRRITSIKGLSEARRLPRLGKIYLGKKIKRNLPSPECSCGPQEGCFKCTYPKETPNFVVPPEVAKVYGQNPTMLRVKVPVNTLNVVFPQAYKYYGSGRGLKCTGDGEVAYRMNDKTFAMEQVDCPCPRLDAKDCQQTGVLNVILYEVSKAGVYQITTRSINSIRDVNSGLDFVACSLGGTFAMVPLLLRRVETETQFKGQKAKHYTLQILLDAESPEFGKKLPTTKENLALPPADEIRPDLAGPVASEEELVAEEALAPAPTGDEINTVVTPVKQIFLRTEKDAQGKSFKRWRIVTEAGYYFTRDENLKNMAQAAMRNVDFVEIGFVLDPQEGNLIKSLKKIEDEKAQ
jgi:hypothetical protein